MINSTLSVSPVVDALLGMSAGEFVQRHWGQTYCYAKSGVDRVRALVGAWSLDEWRNSTERAYNWPGSPRGLGAEMRKPNLDGGRASVAMRLQPQQMTSVFEMGATVIGDILDPQVSLLAAMLKRDLAIPGPVSTYASLSPEGSGAPLHFDPFHVFVIQLEGRKTWQVSKKPVVVNPPQGRYVAADGTVQGRQLETETVENVSMELDSVTLEPGDVLYVPGGVAHATEALEQSLSIMVNFTPPRLDVLAEMIVRSVLGGESRWGALPAGGPNGAPAAYLNAGLARLRELFARLDSNSDEVASAWHGLIANMGDVMNGYAGSLRPREAATLSSGQRLRVTQHFPLRFKQHVDSEGDTHFVIHLGAEKIQDSGAGADLLRNIVERGEFTAEEACHWSEESYDWEVVKAYLERLVEQGLLIPAEAEL
jgi:hypothetical protein